MQLIHEYGLNQFWLKRPVSLFPRVRKMKQRPKRSKKLSFTRRRKKELI